MANIPVQRKRGQGIPWWTWLLLGLGFLALLGFLLWSVVQGQDRETARPATTGAGAATGSQATGSQAAPPQAATPPANPAAPAGVPLTDLPIGQPDQLVALVGQPVHLSGLKVQEVVGDKTFWVGPSTAQRLFVFLEEDPTAGQQVEGKVDVNPGQTLTIQGELRKLPSAEEAQRLWDITPQSFEALKQEQVYLFARSVKVTSGS